MLNTAFISLQKQQQKNTQKRNFVYVRILEGWCYFTANCIENYQLNEKKFVLPVMCFSEVSCYTQ